MTTDLNGGVMDAKYVGISEYFATGEGVTYVMASGTKTQIYEFAGPYFSIGLALYSFADIKSALIECEGMDETRIMDDKRLRAAYILKTHLPSAANFIKQFGFGTFSYKFHYNLS
ncbi:hypothetical protein [Shewanella sp. AC91-MNA-CIBAN-0169]|jgi:hypothetical protein|uniref:hypothetical protein n=1 Tax=Shewanella TaxID=22 RepID=UPI0033290960|tara:strand:- start:3976 stop:4320 length:345 start_codon:yes stop_codon:yes gene_type:complete